ncbi:MAG TPA: UDP-N-acetylmuramate:L-alanyl-gamma-D-glutamyl-meso-diaminopimelate ligase [Marinobacterium sp.]|nr:UDP-N-acetylmuramate:L-alanyl-gamma-D-glutamyl-meso-diaminopimelate ligase [Marinobacterium sp.]
MHLHILGICGTFMGSLALLAREMGHQVTGSDLNVYPPMSTQLKEAGIGLIEGYDPSQLDPRPDLVVIGNAMSRGNPCVEAVLDQGLAYCSGPQWLHDHLLADRWVLAVAGTHGKTTTASMLAWILEYAGMKPGYLIGGVPLNFERSARVGETDFFVIEADEYDTAFFDKRSKFLHYAPRTLVMNNLEFDHADIFPDLAAIETQFHHLLRIVPASGQVIYPRASDSLGRVVTRGCWSQSLETGVAGDAWFESDAHDPQSFAIYLSAGEFVNLSWGLSGDHNKENALHAVLAARHVGVPLEVSAAALCEFRSVKRRMELRGKFNGVRLYDDFAHHPTAIATTLEGLRKVAPDSRIVAVVEPRSNTMKQGHFSHRLAACASAADMVFWFQPSGQGWSLTEAIGGNQGQRVFEDFEALIAAVVDACEPETELVVMSNGSFGGLHERLIQALEER